MKCIATKKKKKLHIRSLPSSVPNATKYQKTLLMRCSKSYQFWHTWTISFHLWNGTNRCAKKKKILFISSLFLLLFFLLSYFFLLSSFTNSLSPVTPSSLFLLQHLHHIASSSFFLFFFFPFTFSAPLSLSLSFFFPVTLSLSLVHSLHRWPPQPPSNPIYNNSLGNDRVFFRIDNNPSSVFADSDECKEEGNSNSIFADVLRDSDGGVIEETVAKEHEEGDFGVGL